MTPESNSIPGDRRPAEDGPGVVTAFTLVVWVACVTVGLTGLWSAPSSAPRSPPASQPVTQVVSVVLQSEPTPPVAAVTPPAAAVAEAAVLPSVPTAAVPSPAIAFAVPVAGPARVGPAAAAVPVGRGSAPVVRTITFGRGEGAQPAPEYPDAARAAGQQGTVVIRFTIDPDGRITRAWAVRPSPFPLLNDAATAAVRDSWRYGSGPPRVYDVPITFRLNPAD